MAQIIEAKRLPEGGQELFPCEAVAVGAGEAVVRFHHERERSAGGFRFPVGSVTYGFFWRRRHYTLYRFLGPDGGLIAHRFDVVDEVSISRRRIEYLDLALDMWVGPAGHAWLEDEEEVAEYVARGLLSAEQLALIERTRRHLLSRFARIIEATKTPEAPRD